MTFVGLYTRCLFVYYFSFLTICITESFNFDDVCSTGKRLEVSYGSLDVTCGYSLNDAMTILTSPPTIRFAEADKTKLYEVLMLDPDAPSISNPTCRSWLHLIMSNVPGSGLTTGVSAENNAIYTKTAYKPPTPPKGSGYHRYIFIVYSHGEHLDLNPPSNRCGFNIETFVTQHNLPNSPDATNMFKTEEP